MTQHPAVVRRGLALAAAATLAVVTVGLGVVVALLARTASQDAADNDARTTALSTARQSVVNFTSFDYRKLDDQFRIVERETTGDFLDQFKAEREDIRKRFTQTKAVTTTRIVDAALAAVRGDEATALVAMDQTISSTELKQPVTSRQRVEVHLVRSGDRWLVDDVAPVG